MRTRSDIVSSELQLQLVEPIWKLYGFDPEDLLILSVDAMNSSMLLLLDHSLLRMKRQRYSRPRHPFIPKHLAAFQAIHHHTRCARHLQPYFSAFGFSGFWFSGFRITSLVTGSNFVCCFNNAMKAFCRSSPLMRPLNWFRRTLVLMPDAGTWARSSASVGKDWFGWRGAVVP